MHGEIERIESGYRSGFLKPLPGSTVKHVELREVE